MDSIMYTVHTRFHYIQTCLHDEINDVAYTPLVEYETSNVGLQMRCETLLYFRIANNLEYMCSDGLSGVCSSIGLNPMTI